jgi:hypothetical protein
MHQIRLSDQLYQEAQRKAAEAGFTSVDEYVADVLQHDLQEETENLDHLFTPERLAHIDLSAAEIDAGQGLSLEQVDAQLAKRRAEWLRQNSR